MHRSTLFAPLILCALLHASSAITCNSPFEQDGSDNCKVTRSSSTSAFVVTPDDVSSSSNALVLPYLISTLQWNPSSGSVVTVTGTGFNFCAKTQNSMVIITVNSDTLDATALTDGSYLFQSPQSTVNSETCYPVSRIILQGTSSSNPVHVDIGAGKLFDSASVGGVTLKDLHLVIASQSALGDAQALDCVNCNLDLASNVEFQLTGGTTQFAALVPQVAPESPAQMILDDLKTEQTATTRGSCMDFARDGLNTNGFTSRKITGTAVIHAPVENRGQIVMGTSDSILYRTGTCDDRSGVSSLLHKRFAHAAVTYVGGSCSVHWFDATAASVSTVSLPAVLTNDYFTYIVQRPRQAQMMRLDSCTDGTTITSISWSDSPGVVFSAAATNIDLYGTGQDQNTCVSTGWAEGSSIYASRAQTSQTGAFASGVLQEGDTLTYSTSPDCSSDNIVALPPNSDVLKLTFSGSLTVTHMDVYGRVIRTDGSSVFAAHDSSQDNQDGNPTSVLTSLPPSSSLVLLTATSTVTMTGMSFGTFGSQPSPAQPPEFGPIIDSFTVQQDASTCIDLTTVPAADLDGGFYHRHYTNNQGVPLPVGTEDGISFDLGEIEIDYGISGCAAGETQDLMPINTDWQQAMIVAKRKVTITVFTVDNGGNDSPIHIFYLESPPNEYQAHFFPLPAGSYYISVQNGRAGQPFAIKTLQLGYPSRTHWGQLDDFGTAQSSPSCVDTWSPLNVMTSATLNPEFSRTYTNVADTHSLVGDGGEIEYKFGACNAAATLGIGPLGSSYLYKTLYFQIVGNFTVDFLDADHNTVTTYNVVGTTDEDYQNNDNTATQKSISSTAPAAYVRFHGTSSVSRLLSVEWGADLGHQEPLPT